MSNIIPFSFEEKQVRVVVDEQNNPWFNAGDVCRVLGFGNPRQAVESHVDQEDVQKLDALSAGGKQQTNHINESGLYALIFGSTKEEAKRFKRWVTSEVLPSIRKTGDYATPTAQAKERATNVHGKVSTLIQINYWMAKVPGVDPVALADATLESIRVNTGLSMEEFRKVLPSGLVPAVASPVLNLQDKEQREQAFVRIYKETGNATEALRMTHDVSGKSRAAVSSKALRLKSLLIDGPNRHREWYQQRMQRQQCQAEGIDQSKVRH